MGRSVKTEGIILGILGVMMFSAKSVIVKMAYGYQIDPETLLLFRMVIALPFYAAVALWNKPKNPVSIRRKDYFGLVIFGILGYYLASYLDFVGLQYIKASLERIILFLYPSIVLVLSMIFLKIKISKTQIFAIVLTYIGIIITFWEELEMGGDEILLGSALIFISSICYASYLVGSGQLIPKFGSVVYTAYVMIVSCASMIVHYVITNNEADLLGFPIEVYVMAFGLSIFATIIPSFMVSSAVNKLGANNFSIIGSLGPVSTIMLANITLGESLTELQFLGAALVILGIWIVNRK